ncbi:MAG: tetratricopeptide repeat protein [Anaerolineae bacterium]
MQPDNPFGNWLKQRRKTLDLTQTELAERVGCAPVTVKKIEMGSRRPSKQIAERLAAVLEIEPSTQSTFVAFARGLSANPPAVRPHKSWSAAVHHLPSPSTTFVGMSRELAHLQRLLDAPDCRLLTLVGPGGIGKTRLAVETALRHSAHFVDGAHFVALAPVASADLLPFAIGDALDFSFVGQEAPIVQLVTYLRDKILLLLLDNFEHLLDSVPLLVNLLAGAPHLKVLITSQERLNLHGEWVLPITGMDYPLNADDDDFESYSAVQLFVLSAQRVQPDFSLRGNTRDVLRICQLVEGMPLALELAATWVRLLPCSQIAEKLTSSLDFLASPLRNLPERQRSLRAVFDHSWNLLSHPEQMALAKLSVFRGAFYLQAAEEVGGASLSVLASLADKSLVHPDGMGRYALHELLRQYAADQLTYQVVEAGHRERAIDYLAQAAERASRETAHRRAAGLLSQAIAIAEEVGKPALLGQLHHKRGQALLRVSLWVEARPEIIAALAAADSENLDELVEMLLELGDIDFFLHDAASQRQHVTEALAHAEAAQRADLVVAVIVKMGFVETNDGNLNEAVSLYERALAQGGHREAQHSLGRTFYWLGRYADAVPHLRQAVALGHSDAIDRIFPLQDLGLVLAATGQYTEAVRTFEEAKRLSHQHEVWPLVARSVANLAGFHLDVFDYAGNEALAEEARAIARSADFVLAEVSAGLDLLLNFARRKEIERAAILMPEVAAAVEKARGSHAWLWRLRLAQARAELAYARGDWVEALRLAERAIQLSREVGRVKYQVLALKTRAQTLAALAHVPEAIVDLRNALDVARLTGDPALFFQIAAALLALEDDDALAQEASAAAHRISAALPNEEMRQIFEAAQPVQQIARLMG